MQPSCSDVCEIVHKKLSELGFKIDECNEDHTDMIEALEKVRFVKIEEEQKGFMVTFEHRTNGVLRSGHFPDKHVGEPLIKTEEEAWESARKFAENSSEDYVNIYVIREDFSPVKGYEEKKLRKYL